MEDIGRLEHRHGVSSCYGKAKQYLLAPADWRGLWKKNVLCGHQPEKLFSTVRWHMSFPSRLSLYNIPFLTCFQLQSLNTSSPQEISGMQDQKISKKPSIWNHEVPLLYNYINYTGMYGRYRDRYHVMSSCCMMDKALLWSESIYLSIYLCVCLSVHLSICLSIYLSISICLNPLGLETVFWDCKLHLEVNNEVARYTQQIEQPDPQKHLRALRLHGSNCQASCGTIWTVWAWELWSNNRLVTVKSRNFHAGGSRKVSSFEDKRRTTWPGFGRQNLVEGDIETH